MEGENLNTSQRDKSRRDVEKILSKVIENEKSVKAFKLERDKTVKE